MLIASRFSPDHCTNNCNNFRKFLLASRLNGWQVFRSLLHIWTFSTSWIKATVYARWKPFGPMRRLWKTKQSLDSYLSNSLTLIVIWRICPSTPNIRWSLWFASSTKTLNSFFADASTFVEFIAAINFAFSETLWIIKDIARMLGRKEMGNAACNILELFIKFVTKNELDI